MSNLFKYTKRVLTSVLAAAVVLTAIPSTAFGAELPDEDFAEAVEVQEAEVADEAVVEEEAAATDGTGNEEEVIIEGEEENPDTYYQDADIIFNEMVTDANVGRKILVLAGDEVSELVTELDSDTVSTEFDSTRDFVFYVAPLMGWTWDAENPVTLEGEYTLKGEATPVKLTKDTDYTVTKSDVKMVNGGATKYYDTYDFDAAYKVTIKANTTFAQYLAKYKTAYAQDGSADGSHVKAIFAENKYPYILVSIAKNAGGKSDAGVTKNGKFGIAKVTYKDGLTDPAVSLAQDKFRWTYGASGAGLTKDLSDLVSSKDNKKVIKVEATMVSTSADPVKLDEKKGDFTWSSATKAFALKNTAKVNELFALTREVNGSYKLNLTFSVDNTTPYVGDTVNVISENDTYVTATASLDYDTTKVIGDETAVEVAKDDNLCITLAKTTTANDPTRVIQGLDYTEEGTADTHHATADEWAYAVAGKAWNSGTTTDGQRIYKSEDSTNWATFTGEATNLVDGTTVSTGYVIPAGAGFKGDITLIPVTGEQVVVNGGAGKVTFTVGGVSKTIAGSGSTTLTGAAGKTTSTSDALTGKEYKIVVAPTTGNKVTNLSVDMYDKTGTAPTRYSIGDSTHPITKGDYGEYTIPAITGKLEVNVTAAAETDDQLTLTKVLATGTNDADIKLYRLSDKKEIVVAPGSKIQDPDTALEFKAVPDNGKAIKKVSISTDGGVNYTELKNGVMDGTGAVNYKVDKVSANLAIKVESEKGLTFRKVTNPYATVKVNGVEIADNKTLTGVPVGNGVTIEVAGKNGAEVDTFYYYFNTRSDDNNTNVSSESTIKGAATKSASKTGATLSASYLTDIIPNDARDKEFKLYVKTERAEDASKYTGKIVTSEGLDVSEEGLTLYSGGKTLTSKPADIIQSTLTTTFTRKDYKTVATQTATNTKYSLTEGATEAAFGTQGAVGYNILTTTNAANKSVVTDTITVKEVVPFTNWLDGLSYVATGALTVNPLKDLYDGYDANISYTSAGSEAPLGKVLRTYTDAKKATFNDYAEVKVLPYTLNDDGDKVTRTKDMSGTSVMDLKDTEVDPDGKKLIKSIAFATTPVYKPTQLVKDILVEALTGDYVSTGRKISQVKDAGNVTVTTDIEFADGSTTQVTGTIPVTPQSYGYAVLPVSTTNGSTTYSPATIALELASGKATSATIECRVFEGVSADPAATVAAFGSEKDIEDAIKAGTVVEVTDDVTFVNADPTYNVKGGAYVDGNVTSTLSGNKYTLTAAKVINASAKRYWFVGSIDGAPLVKDVGVTVGNKLTTYTATLDLTDSTGANLPDETGNKYKFPKFDATKAGAKALLDLPHSDIEEDTAANKTSGYVFDQITAGQVIKLPDINAFDATTVNPKRTLVGWTVQDSYGTEYVPVNSDWSVVGTTTIDPIWAYKYDVTNTNLGDGQVVIFIDESESPVAANDKLAKDATISLSARAYTIDWEKTPDSSGHVVWSEDPVKLTGTTKAVMVDPDDDSLNVETAGKIKAVKTTGGSGVNYTFNDGAYTYSKRTASNADLAVEASVYEVATADAWKVEVDPISIEEGITDNFDVYFFKDESGKTRDDSDYTHVANILTEVNEAGKDYVSAAKATTPGKISVYGLEAGKSATVKVTVVTDQNVTYSVNVPVTVTTTTKKIIVKSVGGVAVPTAEKNEILILADDAATATDIVFGLEDNGTEQPVGSEYDRWKFGKVTPEPDSEEEKINVVTSLAQKGSVVATATLTQIADKYGQGAVWASYELDKTTGKSFTQVIPVKTYYAVEFNGGAAATADPYPAYTVKKGTDVVATGTTSVEKVVYDGEKIHNVAGAANYTATYTPDSSFPEGALSWIGWSNAAAASFDAEKADYANGVAIQFNEDDDDAWPFSPTFNTISLWAEFGPIPVESITGFDNVIRITDAEVGTTTDKSTSTKTLTDYAVESITAKPGTSGAHIFVSADDAGMFTIVDGDTPNRNDANNDGLSWTTRNVVTDKTVTAVTVTMTPNTAKTLRSGDFTVAKVAGKVGESKIHVVSGSHEYDIPVYANGEYEDTTVTPSVYRYMEDGKNFVEGTKTVEGKTHFYKDSARITEGVVFVTVAGAKKLVMIADGKQVTTPAGGTKSYGGNNYYIGKDGYVKYDGLFNGEGSSDTDKKYYADENGVLATSELKEVSGKTYYFNSKSEMAVASSSANKYELDSVDNAYYVNAAGDVAKSGVFKVAGIDRLFRDDATIVTYGDADVKDGKIKQGNITYVIDPTTSEAKPDKKMVNAKFTWTTKKPAKFEKSSPLPTSDWEITYKFEGETTEQKVTGTVTATADPAGYQTMLDLKKVEFTFAVPDLTGYFSDSKGEKALTATPAVWTYTFNGEIGTGGGIEIVGFEEGQEFKFTGGAIKPPVEVWDNDLGEKLVLGVDYTLSYKNNTKITTDSSKMPIVTVNGKGNYAGKNVTRTFKIVNPIEGETDLTATVKKVDLGFTTTPVYNGEEWYPDTITVDGNVFQHSSGDSYTTEGTANYVFTFSNNVDAGTATVGVTGQDGKTKKKTFKINKVDLSKVPTANLEISPADAEWAVKGAVPATTVTYTPEGGSAITLVEGQDYTLKVNYADKKKNVADGNTVTITGKGTNFSKRATSTETFKIDPYTITDASLLEVVAPAGAKVKAVKTTVVDKNGVKIDKKNYTVNVYDSTDTLLAPTASLAAGSTYKVEVVAPPTGNIDGSASFEFVAAADMSKAKVTLSKDLKKNGVAYTGEAIDVTKIQSGELIKNLFTTGDITVEYKNPSTKKYEKLTWDEDFEVVGYQNNVKKGTMTVYIRAKDDSTKVSGVKNFKIKISAKTMKKAD